jgi:hypothetical protein
MTPIIHRFKKDPAALPDQVQEEVLLPEVRPAGRIVQPTSKTLLKIWPQLQKALESYSKCRNCEFWGDPGRLASYGACYRLVLSHSDLLTAVEYIVPGEPLDILYTPEDFLCPYFQIRPLEAAGGQFSTKDQLLRLNQAVERLFAPLPSEITEKIETQSGVENVR